jgi:hypothetical protein
MDRMRTTVLTLEAGRGMGYSTGLRSAAAGSNHWNIEIYR